MIKFLGRYALTPAGVLFAAILIIQSQCARIDHLHSKVASLETMNKQAEDKAAKYARALEDTLKAIGNYVAAADSLKKKAKIPQLPVNVDQAATPDTGEIRMSRSAFDQWYRDNCTGLIKGRDSTTWLDGTGALVDYGFYYGLGTNEYNWMTILPYDQPSSGGSVPAITATRKPGFSGGIEWHLSKKTVRIGGDITFKSKWAPSAAIEWHDEYNPENGRYEKIAEIQFGIRRSF